MEENTQTNPPAGGEKKEKGNIVAILSYIGILFLVPLLAYKDDASCQYHAKQGLVLFIAEIATGLIAWIPILGWFIGLVAIIVWMVLSIIGIVNVVSNKQVPLPIIGSLASKISV